MEDATGGKPFAKFSRGSVTRIYVENFMIHNKLELQAGPSCNIVLGPNGSGKSSVVCALVLGLGGDHRNVLGRGRTLDSFIKHTETTATIIIHLCESPSSEIVIRRVISRLRTGLTDLPEWSINGTQVTLQDVRDTVRQLRTQVDNLCQILPQEKIGEFTKVSSIRLLEETEKALGTSQTNNDQTLENDLYATHAKIVHLQDEWMQRDARLQNKKEQLKRDEEILNRLKEHKEIFLRRDQILSDIAEFEKYLPWLRVHEKTEEIHETETKYQEQRNLVTNQQHKIDSATNIREQLLTQREMHADETTKRNKKYKNAMDQYQIIQDKMKKTDSSIDHIESRISSIQRQILERDATLRGLKADRDTKLNELSESTSTSDLQQQIKQLRVNIGELSDVRHDLYDKMKTLDQKYQTYHIEWKQAKHALDKFHQQEQQSILALKRLGSRYIEAAVAYEAYTIVNKMNWEGEVYGPVCIHVSPRNVDIANLLESHIKRSHKLAFVCTHQDDFERLANIQVRGMKIPVFRIGDDVENLRRQTRLSSDYKRKMQAIGFVDTLDEFLEAPEPVLGFLLSKPKLQDVIVGGQLAHRAFTEAPQNLSPPAGVVIATSTNLEYYKSGGATKRSYIQVKPVEPNPARYFFPKPSINDEYNQTETQIKHIEQSIEKIRVDRNKIQNEINECVERINQMKHQMRDLEQQRKQRRVLETELENIEKEIEIAENESIQALTATIDELNAKILKLKLIRIGDIKQLPGIFKTQYDTFCAKTASDTWNHKLLIAVQTQDTVIEEEMSKLQKEKDTLDSLKERIKQLKYERSQIRTIALTKCDIHTPEGREWISSMRVKTHEFISNMMETPPEHINARMLELHIEGLKRRANEFITDENILEKYEQIHAQVLQLREEIANSDESQEDVMERMEHLAQAWKDALNADISAISQRFQQSMQRLGFDGKVEMDNNPIYSKCGIKIFVKYRDYTSFQPLSATTQSGGERAVATMLYLLAIQPLTPCPFRVIDEINQGMDADNERAVMGEIFRACAPSINQHQYFMISPKLLPRLEYPEHVTIHVVYNGCYVLASSALRFTSLLEHKLQNSHLTDTTSKRVRVTGNR